MSAPPDVFAESINENLSDGWMKANGLRLTKATVEEIRAEMEIRPEHRQAYGIVHGGVHCAIVETLASVGAGVNAFADGKSVVGLENHTSFLRAVREGTLTAVARPLTRGRRSQVWETTITGPDGKIAATGRVRMLVIEPDSDLAGEAPRIK
jgi:1,4-dihydroxy-2-naphthoyl-CoA hydrolase